MLSKFEKEEIIMIVSTYYKVTFKNNHKKVYETEASLGCIRYGHPDDTMYLYKQAVDDLTTAITEGTLQDDTWTSVIINFEGLVEYTAEDMAKFFDSSR